MGLILCSAAAVGAQQSLELPVPQGQPTIRIRPRRSPVPPPQAPTNNVQTIPAMPPPPPPAAQIQPAPEITPPPVAQRVEPILPPVFRGCWRGTVYDVDRIQRLPGARPIGPWMPKTYVLCYRRVGNGPFQLTFTEAGMEGGRGVTNTTGQMRLVSTDGRDYASLRAVLRFDEYRKHPSFFGSPTFGVEEITDLNCDIEPDGMHASGIVYGTRNGVPWFRAWWHALFIHISSIPE